MINVPVITKRELHTYFLSPIAYIVLTGFALAHGMLFVTLILRPTMDLGFAAQGVFGLVLWLIILPAPLLTMRLLSEEVNSGTIETLMTTPVTEAEVVLGKFVGALFFSVFMFIPILVEIAFLRFNGPMDVGPLLSGFLGMLLLMGQMIAIGLLCSAATRIQIGAAIINFAIVLGLYFLWLLGRNSTTVMARTLRYLSPPWHYFGFSKGVVDTRDLAYFVITTAVFLFLTVKALELRKWR